MYPSPPDGEISRYLPSSSSGSSLPGWPIRVPICRPRFLKLLLLVVVLLMMVQFSLNILCYINYDSHLYVNVPSAESLPSFESRVRWPYNSSSVPLMIGGKEDSNSSIGTEEEVPLLRQMIEAENRRQEMKLKNSAVPSDKIPNEGGGNASAKLIISRSNMNETSASPSKISNNSNKMSDASPEISKISSSFKTSPNNSSSGDAREMKRVLLSKEKSLCPPVPPKLVEDGRLLYAIFHTGIANLDDMSSRLLEVIRDFFEVYIADQRRVQELEEGELHIDEVEVDSGLSSADSIINVTSASETLSEVIDEAETSNDLDARINYDEEGYVFDDGLSSGVILESSEENISPNISLNSTTFSNLIPGGQLGQSRCASWSSPSSSNDHECGPNQLTCYDLWSGRPFDPSCPSYKSWKRNHGGQSPDQTPWFLRLNESSSQRNHDVQSPDHLP